MARRLSASSEGRTLLIMAAPIDGSLQYWGLEWRWRAHIQILPKMNNLVPILSSIQYVSFPVKISFAKSWIHVYTIAMARKPARLKSPKTSLWFLSVNSGRTNQKQLRPGQLDQWRQPETEQIDREQKRRKSGIENGAMHCPSGTSLGSFLRDLFLGSELSLLWWWCLGWQGKTLTSSVFCYPTSSWIPYPSSFVLCHHKLNGDEHFDEEGVLTFSSFLSRIERTEGSYLGKLSLLSLVDV